jgi:signal transduction histidine kinase
MTDWLSRHAGATGTTLGTPWPLRGPAHGAAMVALFALYYLTARMGLAVGPVSGFATFIWPPTGLSLTALYLFGTRLWPAVAAAAFAANWSVGASIPVALGIAVGNTLEALVAVLLLRRFGFQRSLERLRDVFLLVFLAGFVSTAVSATVGTGSLYLGGKVDGAALGLTWRAWWLGDLMADLVIAPFLLAWSARRPRMPERKRDVARAAALMALVVLGSATIFTDWMVGTNDYPKPFMVIPVLMLVAVTLGQLAMTASLLIVTGTSLAATVYGHGRFWTGALPEALFQGQVYFAIISVSKLVLAATVSERRKESNELKASNAQRLEAIQARDEFLSIASHELKTPLTSLKLQTQMRKRRLERGELEIFSPERLRKMVSDDDRQITRLSRLVDDMLDISRLHTGKLTLEREPVDLVTLISETVERFGPQLASAGIEVRFTPVGRVVGNWDRFRLEQVFVNLLTNAMKYGQARPVHVSIAAEGSTACLKVRDEGSGIDPKDHERIFQQFERASRRDIGGLGLGLYIVREIVAAHGGRVWVESAVGKGSTFSVELPGRIAEESGPARLAGG